MNTKVAILAIVGLVSVVGLLVGVYFVQQSQLLQKDASVPGGIAKVSISPANREVAVGETFNADVNFSTGGVAIKSVDVVLSYTYTTTDPTFDVEVVPNPQLAASGQWNFPITSYSASNGTAQIHIYGVNVAAAGYNSGESSANLAQLIFKGKSAGTAIVTFEISSKVTQATDTGAVDILLTPDSTGKYTVTGGSDPQPTTAPGVTPTIEPGVTPTAEPTSQPGVTATPGPTTEPDPSGDTGNTMSITYPPNNGTITDTTPTIRGMTPASSTVYLDFTSGLSGSVTADTSGNWSWTPSTPLSGGVHTVTASNSTNDDEASATFTVTTDTGSTSLPEAGSVHLTVFLTFAGIALLIAGAWLLL